MGTPITFNLSDLQNQTPQGNQGQSPQQPQPPNADAPITFNMSELNPSFGQPQPRTDELAINDNDSALTKVGKAAGGVLEGIGEGVFSTAAGAADIANKAAGAVGITDGEPGAVSNELHELAGDNEQRSTAASIGYGGESLMEMMLGDEALKALPLAKRLGIVSKTMAILEKSPTIMRALKTGATVLKMDNPVVQEALKAAVMQGGQTFVKTGGDAGQAAEDAAIAGTLGAGLGTAGKLFSRGGKAAKTVSEMSDIAKNAPLEGPFARDLADHINAAKQNVEEIFDRATQSAEESRASVVNQAEAEKNAATNAADETLATRKSQAEEMLRQRQEDTAANQEQQKQGIEQGRQAAQKYAQTTLVSGLDKLAGEGAADPEDLAKQVNDAINQYEADSHTAFENGINGDNGIVTRLKDTTTPVAESKISSEAGKLLKTPDPNEHEAVIEAMAGAGDKLDARVKNLLTNLKKGTVIKGEGEDATEEPMKDWTADSLVKFRQSLRKWAAGYQRGDLNRQVLGKLINSVDDTLEGLAEKAHDEAVLPDYQKLRQTYKSQRAVLDSTVADKLKLTDPDKALDNVSKYLTSGNNPLAKLGTIRQVIGDGSMQELAKSQVGQWRSLAETDPQKFVKDFNKLSDPVKSAFFGPKMSQQLQDIADTFTHTSEFADQHAKELLGEVSESGSKAAKATRGLFGNTGPGGKQLGGLVGEGYKGAHARELETIAGKYDDAVNTAQEAYDSAIEAAKGSQSAALEPFRGSFMNSLSTGKINEALMNGQVDAQDIRGLKAAIGDKWKGIADGIFQRAVADASPKGRFDPEKLVNWWTNIKPEVRQEMFDMGDPANMRKVRHVMDSMDAASVKRMVKFAGAYPTAVAATGTLGAGIGSIAGVIGPPFLGTLGEVIGGLMDVGLNKGAIKDFAEWVSNHPNTWKSLGLAAKVAASPAAKAAGKIAPFVPAAVRRASSMPSVYNGLQESLGDGAAPAQSTTKPNSGALNPYSNPEAQPREQSFKLNRQWAKPGPYVTHLSPEDESEFMAWAKKNPQAVEGELGPTPDYDIRGYWKAMKAGDPLAVQSAKNKHFPDKWKTPYSGVFSKESKYALPNAPHWEGNKLVTADGRLVTAATY